MTYQPERTGVLLPRSPFRLLAAWLHLLYLRSCIRADLRYIEECERTGTAPSCGLDRQRAATSELMVRAAVIENYLQGGAR